MTARRHPQLSAKERRAVRQAIALDGIASTSKCLGVTRATLALALARLPMRRRTIATIRAALSTSHRREADAG